MYSNNILNFQESTTIFNAGKLIEGTTDIYVLALHGSFDVFFNPKRIIQSIAVDTDHLSCILQLFDFSPGLYIYIYKVKFVTVVKGDKKAPFSIATTLRRVLLLFPGLLHFTLDTYFILLSVKQGGITYHF